MKSIYYSIRYLAFRLVLKITSSHYYSQNEGLISGSQKSKCGFMIMNSGLSNITGRSFGKYSASELLKIIPNSQIHEETPITGPDNYILIWENSNK